MLACNQYISLYVPPHCEANKLLICGTDTYKYGFLGLNNIETEWNGSSLAPPSLNISAFYSPDNDFYARDWKHPGSGQALFNNASLQAYGVFSADDSGNLKSTLNETFYIDYIQRKGTCKPVKDVRLIQMLLANAVYTLTPCSIQLYSWGFSYPQLCVMCTLMLLWSIGTVITWLKAYYRLSLLGCYPLARELRGLKGLVAMAEVVRKELGDAGIDFVTLTEKELQLEIKRFLKGGTVSVSTEEYKRSIDGTHKKHFEWAKAETRAYIVILGFFGCLLMTPFGSSWSLITYPWAFMVFISVTWAGTLNALMIGLSTKNRVIIAVSWSILGAVLGLSSLAAAYLRGI